MGFKKLLMAIFINYFFKIVKTINEIYFFYS